MEIACLDLEGVLVPEIWIAFAEKTGIEALKATTRDIPDYDVLMKQRLRILDEHGLKLKDIQEVIATLKPLEGAVEFVDWLRERFQVVILSDTFYEFSQPLMRQLGFPTLLCHRLITDETDRVEAGQPLVKQALIVPANETREVEVDLLDGYRIVRGQSYTVTPALEFAGMRFFGPRLTLEVQPGIELLKRDYGLSAAGTARTVSLRLINRDRSDRIFFRIDDPSTGYCLGVYELGRVIRFFVPRMEQDRDGLFHVLHQSAPDRFVHSTFDYDGRPQGVKFFSAEVGSIRLVRDESGGVSVVGGSPFEADPDNPGMLVAPAPPPAQPYTLDTRKLTAKEKSALPEQKRGKKIK